MDLSTYSDLIEIIKEMNTAGVVGVLVFKPDCTDIENAEESHPDMIISTSSDPAVIAALLGNNNA